MPGPPGPVMPIMEGFGAPLPEDCVKAREEVGFREEVTTRLLRADAVERARTEEEDNVVDDLAAA